VGPGGKHLLLFVPDILLTATALFSSRIPAAAFARHGGGAAGGSLLFFWGQRQPERALRAVDHVPFITQTMLDQVEKDSTLGDVGHVQRPHVRHSLQSYAVQAARHGSWPLFLIASVPARLERCCWPGWFSPRYRFPCGRGSGASAGGAFRAGLYWIVVYAIFWTAIGKSEVPELFSPGAMGS